MRNLKIFITGNFDNYFDYKFYKKKYSLLRNHSSSDQFEILNILSHSPVTLASPGIIGYNYEKAIRPYKKPPQNMGGALFALKD